MPKNENAKNIAIAQPREQNARKNKAKTVKATFRNPNSTMNSLFNFNVMPRKKLISYSCGLNKPRGDADTRTKNEKKKGTPLPPNVGQMDRINRLKANNSSKERNVTCQAGP